MMTPYSQIAEMQVSEAIAYIRKLPCRIISEITIAELILACIDHSPQGIYVTFSADGACQYVGCTKSRSLSERVVAHLDPSPGAWLNRIARRISEKDSMDYKKAVQTGLALKLHLISIPYDLRDRTTKIERTFIHFMRPRLNRGARLPVGVTAQTRLSQII